MKNARIIKEEHTNENEEKPKKKYNNKMLDEDDDDFNTQNVDNQEEKVDKRLKEMGQRRKAS